MAIDKKAYATSKVYTNQVALGISSMRVEGNTVYFTIIDTGEEVGVTLPTPADGASITEVDVDENNYLICTLSNGSTVKSTNPINVVIEVVSDGVQADFEQTDNTADDFIKNKPKFKVITEDEINELVGVTDGEIEVIIPEEVSTWMTEHEKYAETLDEAIQKNMSDIETVNATLNNKANKSEVYSKEETNNKITEKIAEIVNGAPEDFDTLKEMSDWLTEHEDSAATMNTAILKNKEDIAANTEAIEQNKSDILSAENGIAVNCATLGTQVTKNILKLVTINPTNGLTVTVNDDKSITINGTSTNYNAITLMRGLNLSLDKRYTMSISDVATGMYVFIGDTKQENTYQHTATTITITPKVETNNVWLYCEPATKFNNVTLYPMIRSADITDNTYEPYVPSINERLVEAESDIDILDERLTANEEQTNTNKNDVAINRATLGTQCKNLVIVRPSVSGEYYGTVWTKNADESITINGTVTQNNFPIIADFTPTKIGKYILSGCPKGGGQSSYQLYIEELGYDAGSGVTLNVTELKTYRVKIATYKNYTYDSLTFYPMIRPADITDSTYEPYKPSLQEQINTNKTDISSNNTNLQKQIDTLNGRALIKSWGHLQSKNWYRIFECSVKASARSGIIMIDRYYKSRPSENFILSFNFGITNNKINIISKSHDSSSNTYYIDKIRLVQATSAAASKSCYIDIHYNEDSSSSNYTHASMLPNVISNEPYVPVPFTVISEIPEDYMSIEFDLTGGDVFERLTAIEEAYSNLAIAVQEGANSI